MYEQKTCLVLDTLIKKKIKKNPKKTEGKNTNVDECEKYQWTSESAQLDHSFRSGSVNCTHWCKHITVNTSLVLVI